MTVKLPLIHKTRPTESRQKQWLLTNNIMTLIDSAFPVCAFIYVESTVWFHYLWYSHSTVFVSAKPRQAGSSYLRWGVKGSVSNIHGCEAITSWCDYRRMINTRTGTSINFNPKYTRNTLHYPPRRIENDVLVCQITFFSAQHKLTT